MRGVILAGGYGTRLMPLTEVTNKHLLSVGNTAMIEYPLATLRAAGIREILIVTNREHLDQFESYFSERGESQNISFAHQEPTPGIARALAAAEPFAQGAPITVMLGDNIFDTRLAIPEAPHDRARIWTKRVADPARFGVLTMQGDTVCIEEKPEHPAGNAAVVGLYQYPSDVFDHIRRLSPSTRGEYEITDVNNIYLSLARYDAVTLPEDFFWCDAGTFDSLREADRWARERVGISN